MGTGTCEVTNCGRPRHGRGFCDKHYANLMRIGFPVALQAYNKRSGIRREATDAERAYFAGYFDGEGCLQVAPRQGGGYYARVDFGQTNPTVLLLLESVYGGALASLPGKGRRRPQTRWRLGRAASVKKFLEDVEPFVLEKREQVVAVLRRFFVEEAVGQEALIAELSEMKRRAYGAFAKA